MNVWKKTAIKRFFNIIPIGLSVAVALSLVSALFFARFITNPIKKLALQTKKMSKMQDVEEGVFNNDEIGQLSTDVHNLYRTLKSTISDLKTEMERVKHMEEKQNIFTLQHHTSLKHLLHLPVLCLKVCWKI